MLCCCCCLTPPKMHPLATPCIGRLATIPFKFCQQLHVVFLFFATGGFEAFLAKAAALTLQVS